LHSAGTRAVAGQATGRVDAVFVVRREFERGAVIAVHNLSDQAAPVQLDLNPDAGESLTDLLGAPVGHSSVKPQMTLPAYAFLWMRVVGNGWQAR
jgi:Sucrose hydrolase-like, C-terminal domain